MTINIYKTTADPRALDKITGATLINSTPITVKPTAKVNLLAPVFEVEFDADYLTANYLYCDTFDRYYFISNPSVSTGNRIELACSIDVRQSFRGRILKTPLTVLRSQSIGAPTKYQDQKLPIYPTKKNVTSIEMPENSNAFRTFSLNLLDYGYLLTVVGGAPSE